MDIIIEAVLVHTPYNIETFPVKLTQSNYFIIKQKLKFERSKLVTYLQQLKKDGIIKSNYRPKNKEIQEHLNEVCITSRKIKKTIEKISTIYS